MTRTDITYANFIGGLTEVAPDLMADEELIEAKNMLADERGAIEKAKGTQRVINEPLIDDPVDILVEFGKSDGEIIDLAFSGTNMFKWDGTEIKNDLPNAPLDWTIMNDILYWFDGTNFWQYDGETVKEVEMDTEGDEDTWEEIKSCSFLEQRGQRLFFAQDNSNVLYFSEIGEPNYVKATNYIKAITNDSDFINGLKDWGGALLVFKKDSVFGWFGHDPEEDVEFHKLKTHKGTVSHRTIVSFEDYLIFMADDGVYALHSIYPKELNTVNLTDNKISNIIKNTKDKHKSVAVYYDRSYRLSILDDEDNRKEYRLLIVSEQQGQRGSWFGEFTHPVNCYLTKLEDNKLYSGHTEKGLIFEHDIGDNYDGEPIHMRVVTKPFDLPDKKIIEIKIRRAFVYAKQFEERDSTAKVKFVTDYLDDEFDVDFGESLVWEQGSWAKAKWGWTDLVLKELKLSNTRKGRRIQAVFENNNLDEPIVIYGVGFSFKTRKIKGSRLGVTEVDD